MKPTRSAALRHIPGKDGLPVFGETFAFLKDPFTWSVHAHSEYGPVFRTNMFFEAGVIVRGADFAERMLVDNVAWASAMFALQSHPPDPALVGERWRAMWMQRLENQPLLIDNWLGHQRRDA